MSSGGQEAVRLGTLVFLEILRFLLGETPPALRAQEQIERGRRLGVRAQQKIRILQVFGPAHLGRQEIVRGHRPVSLLVGQRDHTLIHD